MSAAPRSTPYTRPYPSTVDASKAVADTSAASVSSTASLHRHGLLLLSVIAISVLAGSAHIIGFITLTVLGSYATLIVGEHCLTQTGNPERLRLWLLRTNWVVWAGLFVTLELTGVVGTLTGNSATLLDQWAVTLGLPFYVLSMAAANSDVLAAKRTRPAFSLYLLYVIYFPKFMSGPIERPQFLDALERFRFTIDWERFDRAGRWVLLGVFYKFMVGRYLARFYFPEVSDHTLTLATGIVAFELRVYFDLCGYSLMAYGTSLLLGIELTLNFNHPFFAGNLRDFWRSWHISLGRWFHEYVFEPFRRSGLSAEKLALAPMVVFLVSAAWHGITANFFLWGLFHASAFLIYTKFLRHRSWSKLAGTAAFFGVLLFGRLLFMDADLPRLVTKFATLLDPWQWSAIVLNPGTALSELSRLTSPTTWLITLSCITFALVTESQNVTRKLPAYSLFFGWRLGVIVMALALLGACGVEGMIYARQ